MYIRAAQNCNYPMYSTPEQGTAVSGDKTALANQPFTPSQGNLWGNDWVTGKATRIGNYPGFTAKIAQATYKPFGNKGKAI